MKTIGYLHTLKENRTEPVRCPFELTLRSQYDRSMIFVPKLSYKNLAVNTRSSQGLHTAPERRDYGLRSYNVLTVCKKMQTITKSWRLRRS